MRSTDNRITARVVQGKTRLTSLLYRTPLRAFETRHPDDPPAAQVVLSSHGGGMLQGDRVGLAIHAERGARLRVTSGANTHIYRNERAVPTAFTVEGHLADGARVAYLAEPVVLHAQSRYVQRQHWRVAKGARLLVVDRLQPGRTESGEAYAFSRYENDVSIEFDGAPQVLEAFRLEPGVVDPRNAAATLGMNAIVSIYYCCDDAAGRAVPIAPMPEKRRIRHFRERVERTDPGPLMGVIRTEYCVVVRIVGGTRLALEPLVQRVVASLCGSGGR